MKVMKKKKKIFNFEYKQLTKSIQSAKNYIKNDKKIQKNRFLNVNFTFYN